MAPPMPPPRPGAPGQPVPPGFLRDLALSVDGLYQNEPAWRGVPGRSVGSGQVAYPQSPVGVARVVRATPVVVVGVYESGAPLGISYTPGNGPAFTAIEYEVHAERFGRTLATRIDHTMRYLPGLPAALRATARVLPATAYADTDPVSGGVGGWGCYGIWYELAPGAHTSGNVEGGADAGGTPGVRPPAHVFWLFGEQLDVEVCA